MNFIFFVLGLAILVGAIVGYFVLDIADYVGIETLLGAGGLGVFIITISWIAMCGATKINYDNRCTLKVYTTLLVILILAQGALIGFAVVSEGDFQSFLVSQWEGLEADGREKFMEEMNCGIAAEPPMKCGNKFHKVECFDDCYDHIKEELESMILVVMIVGGSVLAYELILVMMACCVIKEKPEVTTVTIQKGKYARVMQI